VCYEVARRIEDFSLRAGDASARVQEHALAAQLARVLAHRFHEVGFHLDGGVSLAGFERRVNSTAHDRIEHER
jgi:hypothetical protein